MFNILIDQFSIFNNILVHVEGVSWRSRSVWTGEVYLDQSKFFTEKIEKMNMKLEKWIEIDT